MIDSFETALEDINQSLSNRGKIKDDVTVISFPSLTLQTGSANKRIEC